MRKFFVLLCASIAGAGVLVTGSAGTASAHVLRQNNGISAELHIPPNDHPLAGQPTELDFSFGDEKNVFSLQDCICQVQLKQNNKLLQTFQPKPSLAGATLDSAVTVRFPAAGTYDVVVSGQPKDSAFHSFQLTYPVRVMAASAAKPVGTKKSSAVIVIALCGLVILGLIGYAIVQNRGRRKA